MGKRGPKPKPKIIRQLEGDPGRLGVIPDDVEIATDMPLVKPIIVEVDDAASHAWDQVVSAVPPGLLTGLDVALVTQYALAWAMLHKAQAEIDNYGVLIKEVKTITKPDGETIEDERYKSNPALQSWRTASDTLFKTADRIGLSPGVRARLALPKSRRPEDEGPKTKFGGLVKIGRR